MGNTLAADASPALTALTALARDALSGRACLVMRVDEQRQRLVTATYDSPDLIGGDVTHPAFAHAILVRMAWHAAQPDEGRARPEPHESALQTAPSIGGTSAADPP